MRWSFKLRRPCQHVVLGGVPRQQSRQVLVEPVPYSLPFSAFADSTTHRVSPLISVNVDDCSIQVKLLLPNITRQSRVIEVFIDCGLPLMCYLPH
jgi:hypothetical protein